MFFPLMAYVSELRGRKKPKVKRFSKLEKCHVFYVLAASSCFVGKPSRFLLLYCLHYYTTVRSLSVVEGLLLTGDFGHLEALSV